MSKNRHQALGMNIVRLRELREKNQEAMLISKIQGSALKLQSSLGGCCCGSWGVHDNCERVEKKEKVAGPG